MNDEMTNFEKVIEIAKKVKLDWVEQTDRGDMPPTVFVERDGKTVAVVMATQIDKHAGLQAAAACRAGFRADAITIVLDAHVKEEKMPEGMTPKQAEEEMSKTYKPGEMQRMCDEEGACERGEIADVLLCHRVDTQGNLKMWMMPYEYHGKDGKDGKPFRWMDEHPVAKQYNDPNKVDETKYSGFIPESLKEIMAAPALLDRDDKIGKLIRESANDLQMDPERQLYHTGRAVLRMLQSQGFDVLDLQTPPEGVKAEPIMPVQAVSLRDVIPEEVGMEIGKLIRERSEEPTFAEELLALLKPHEATIKAKAEKMEIDPKDVNVEEMVASIVNPFNSMKSKNTLKLPFRVKVWNGDQSKYWGLGTYVDDVQVYFVGMPDESIQSFSNAEERPTPEQIAAMGGELIEAGCNPKIILDEPIPESEGRTVVYGCQVWWCAVDEEPEHEGCGHNHGHHH